MDDSDFCTGHSWPLFDHFWSFQKLKQITVNIKCQSNDKNWSSNLDNFNHDQDPLMKVLI